MLGIKDFFKNLKHKSIEKCKGDWYYCACENNLVQNGRFLFTNFGHLACPNPQGQGSFRPTFGVLPASPLAASHWRAPGSFCQRWLWHTSRWNNQVPSHQISFELVWRHRNNGLAGSHPISPLISEGYAHRDGKFLRL